jgi:flagellar hook-associated protein FlgK
MSSLSIGLSALTADHRALDVTGQNLANVNTPGYHRQVTELAERTIGDPVGTGVDVERIRRMVSVAVDQALNASTSTSEDLSAQLGILNQVEAMFTPGDGSINNLLQNFFTQADLLSSKPDDVAQRSVFLNAATALTDGLSGLANQIDQLGSNIDDQTRQAVVTANTVIPQIADLNGQIQRSTVAGQEANALEDKRDGLISQLASLFNIQTVNGDFGQVTVSAGGLPVVVGNQAVTLAAVSDPAKNTLSIQVTGGSAPLNVTSGQVSGLLTVRDQTLVDLRHQLDDLASHLIQGVDQIHATSVPLAGGFTILSGQRAVKDITAPLAQAGMAFPPMAGTLYVSVTDQATGTRTLTPVAIDPSTQSLQDVATALSGVPHLQAVADPQTRTLQVLAQPGFTFDFVGRIPTNPQTTAITGTTTASLAGTYTGTDNDQYTFRVAGTGTVGVTQNLSLEVRDRAGSLLGSFNIGQGYSPGSDLQTADGVVVRLAAGTVNNGDSFSTAVVAAPDAGGLLVGLGLNSFFQGDNAPNIGVRSDLTASPDNLALSRTGEPGDGTALQRLDALRDSTVMANGQSTMQQFVATLVGTTGSRIQALTQRQSAQDTLTQRLTTEQQSLSGVDENQELVNLVQFQRAFQMAGRYVSVIDQTFADLLQILS